VTSGKPEPEQDSGTATSNGAAEVAQARVRLSEVAVHDSIDGVIQRTLDAAEGLTASSIAFFHFLEPDQQTITPQTWSTNTLSGICTAQGKGTHYPIAAARPSSTTTTRLSHCAEACRTATSRSSARQSSRCSGVRSSSRSWESGTPRGPTTPRTSRC